MSTILDDLEDALLSRRTIRVAVCGAGNCGKTVFLTSLLNHLLCRDPDFAPDGWRIVRAERDGDTGAIPPFPYPESRATFVSGDRWPAKTKGVSLARIVLRLERADGRRFRRERILELLDLPGERVADLSMRGRTYPDWCRLLAEALADAPSYAAYLARCRAILDAMPRDAGRGSEAAAAARTAILSAYREHLLAALRSYSPIVVPSVAILAPDGSTVPSRTELSDAELRAELAAAPLGADAERPFAPLPPEAAAEGSAAARTFASNYRAYVREAVDPLAEWLESADRLCHLVDVLGVLNGGPQAYNGAQRLARTVLGLLPTPNRANRILHWLTERFLTHVDDAVLVATKADCVLADADGQRNRFAGLLEQMLGPALDELDLPPGRRHACVCAAVRSTEPAPDDPRALVGRFVDAAGGVPAYRRFHPAEPPARWPASAEWRVGGFPDPSESGLVPPAFDARLDAAPPQIGLGRISRILLGRTR